MKNPLLFIIGPRGWSNRYRVEDPPSSWNLRERVTPWCNSCGRELSLNFDGIRQGIAKCRCEGTEREFLEG